MSPSGEREDDGIFSPTRNLATQFEDMGRVQTPEGNGGPPLPYLSSEQQTPMTPYAHMGMMQLITNLRQEARELRAHTHVSRQTDSNVTMHTASPATSSAAYRPVGAPMLRDLRSLRSPGKSNAQDLEQIGTRSSINLLCRYKRLRPSISYSGMKSTD